MWYMFFCFIYDISKVWLRKFCLRIFSATFSPANLPATFDVQIDLKMKHPQYWKPIQKHIQNLKTISNIVKHPRWKFLQK